MATRSLSITTGWFAGYEGLLVRDVDPRTGSESDVLPRGAARLYDRLSEWAIMVRDHYDRVDRVDVTAGWRDEDVRRDFVAEARDLESDLGHVLGNGWDVRVSPEPGLTCVSLAGEYGCEWPLWIAGGLSDPLDWPMLSSAMVERLGRWALQADPDHHPPPDPVTTETLRRDLARELGDRFCVAA